MLSLYAVAFSATWSAAGVAAVMSLFTWVWKSLHEPMVIALIPKDLIWFAIIVFYLR